MTYAEQLHQLGLAIPLRSIAIRLCGALGLSHMPGFITKEGRRSISYITGPSHVMLSVTFTDQVAEPRIVKQPLQATCFHGTLDETFRLG